jgi:SAM-dependent MidA family methyltransferase
LTKAFEKILGEVTAGGPISFARFMEMALYCPKTGYYEAEEDTIGRGGDYYTSVSVGGVFGQLLALQMAEWLESYDARLKTGVRDANLLLAQIVEGGAHTGQLANDILQWLREHRPGLFAHLEYWIIDPSLARQQWQRRTLAEFEMKVRWAESWDALGSRSDFIPPRVIFANELLDAMPLHRFGWDAKAARWFEWGVAARDGKLVWARLRDGVELPALLRERFPAELTAVLPDQFVLEYSPFALEWWRGAAEALRVGKLLAFDYGWTFEEFLARHPAGGTVRGYRSHQSTTDVLEEPGAQDITAHVDFSAIRGAGEASGLVTNSFQSQEQFLVATMSEAIKHGATSAWTPTQLRQFQTLVHPQHLGRAFRVLVQERSANAATSGIRSG